MTVTDRRPGSASAAYPVGEVARLSGVTVRTLHHYDEIGLLRPNARDTAGYRRYDADDLARLQRVLGYRELGFGLEEIKALLDDPTVDPVEHLRRQHAELTRRIAHLTEVATAIERTLEASAMGTRLTRKEMAEIFDGYDPEQHAAEAEERWGDTPAWKESQRRTAAYTKEDWVRIKADGDAATAAMADALRAGQAPTSPQAMDAAERHRQHISRWFYDCPVAMHRGLADMYVADPRFTATYEKVENGLAQFTRDAIHANADRQEKAGA